MSFWVGDAYSGCTIAGSFTTVTTTGAPSALSGNPLSLVVWKHVGTWSCSTAGLTLSLDCKGVTGWNGWSVNTNADAAFYACGNDYTLNLVGGTVGGTCVNYYVLATFSLKNRASLKPIVTGRDFAVGTNGGGGMDWQLVYNTNAPNYFSCTSFFCVQTVSNAVTATATVDFTAQQAIACTVWNQVQADYDTCGSFGTLLNVPITTRLAPTVAGRTLDVTATGAAGIDWGNLENPTTTVSLSDTSVNIVFTTNSIAPGGITNLSHADASLDARVLADSAAQEISSAVWSCSVVEPATVFPWPATACQVLGFLGAKASNCMRQTSTVTTLRNRADSANIATSNVTCTATTMNRGSFA